MKGPRIGSSKVRALWAMTCLGMVVLLVQPLGAGAAAPPPPSALLMRSSKNFHFSHPWEARCGSDFCGVPSIVRFAFDTPSGADKVDVDVELSLNFKVSSGDKIQVDASYRRDGGPRTSFHPGSYPLTSPRPFRTSTTLGWNAKGLQALGARYVIEIAVNPRHGKDGFSVHASGNKAALTVTELSTSS